VKWVAKTRATTDGQREHPGDDARDETVRLLPVDVTQVNAAKVDGDPHVSVDELRGDRAWAATRCAS
jgi:hypothetical protein